MTDRSDRVLLRYEIDEAALNRTIARANAARQRIAEIRSTLAQVNQAAKPTGDALRNVFDTAERSASKLSQRLQEVERNSKRLRGTLPSQQQSLGDLRGSLTGGGAAGGGLNALNRTEGAVSRTGAALRGLGLGGAGDVVSGAGDILQLVGSLGQLGPAAGVAALAIGGATLAVKLLDASTEDARRKIEAAAEASRKFYTEEYALTTEQAQNRINQEKKLQKSLQDGIAETETKVAAAEAKIRDTIGAGATSGEAGIELDALNKNLKLFKETLTTSEASVTRLNDEFKKGTFAANDAAEAEKRLSEARVKAFQDELERSRRMAGITSQEQIDEQVSSIQAQIDANQKWLEKNAERIAGDEHLAETFEKVEEETKKLVRDLESLKEALPSTFNRDLDFDDLQRGNELQGELIETRERETEMILKATDAMNDFADEAERLSEERNLAKSREGQDFSIKRARDQAEFTRRTAESDSAYYKDRGKKIAAFNREMSDSDNEAQKARIKAVQEANDAQIRAAEDFARTVAGFTEQINDAGANLDAIGVRNAQRGLAAANDQYNLEKRRRDQDATKRIDEIVENAKAQKDARAAAFAEELAEADAEHAIERQKAQEEFIRRTQQEDQDRQLRLQRQQEDYIRQDNARRAAFDKQIQNLQTQLLGPEEQAKVSSYGRQRQSLNDFLNGAVNDVNAAKARVSTADTSRTSTTTTPPMRGPTPAAQPRIATASSFSRGFRSGGRPPIGVPVMINEGRAEPVIFGSPAQVGGSAWGKSGGGVNIGDIYLNGGLAPEQYKAMVKQGIAEAFMEDMN